jgi:hypothetical protein
MRLRKMRHRLAVASAFGVASLAATLTMGMAGAGVASAAITIPPFPSFGVYPEWLPANGQVSNVDHSEGSDTTLFAMQSISDLYAQAGLFPFSCQLTTTNQDCETQTELGSNPNNTQSDTVDNFAASEELQGVNDVGSGNGQTELCGTDVPANTTVDYSRSSKPENGTCTTEVQVGYAKDGVPAVDFQNIDPNEYGTPTGYDAGSSACSTHGQFPSYAALTGATVCTAFPTAGIGPVAAGWLPGDSFTCNTSATCSGTAFTNVANTGGATSVAYRLWCFHGSSSTPDSSQITDWGQLTNLAGGATVGNGTPIGVPIRIIGVNNGSGTAATFNNFAKAGLSLNCSTTSNYNENAASGTDPTQAQGPTNNLEIALENDASQIGDFANADWGATDPADQAVDIATSLYYMGNGAYNTNPNSAEASLEVNAGTVPSGDPTTFTESEMSLNGVTASIAHEHSNAFPTSRTLFNIYRTDTVKASTAGFLNWLCDTNPNTTTPVLGGQEQKGTDHVDGGNYDTDLTNIISGQYGFSRLTDSTLELSLAAQTTANGVVNPNASCDAQLSIATGGATSGGSTITLAASQPGAETLANELANVQDGWIISIPAGYSVAAPTTGGNPTDTITNVNTTTGVLTLSAPLTTGTGTVAPTTVYLPGHPPILAIANANS